MCCRYVDPRYTSNTCVRVYDRELTRRCSNVCILLRCDDDALVLVVPSSLPSLHHNYGAGVLNERRLATLACHHFTSFFPFVLFAALYMKMTYT